MFNWLQGTLRKIVRAKEGVLVIFSLILLERSQK